MSDVEDVTFLPGGTNSHKKALYEPDGVERCRQYVCSQKKAFIVLALVLTCIVVVATIAALARPYPFQCPGAEDVTKEYLAITEKAVTTEGDSSYPYRDIRLPKNVAPISYHIYIHPNISTFDFSGRVQIILSATESTDFIILHKKSLELVKSELTVTDTSRKIGITNVNESAKYEQVYFKLAESINPGVNYTFDLEFEGVIATSLTGFYRSSYKTKSGEQRWLATTQFEPTDARAAFPCFDEPDLKATFSMEIVREPPYIALFNTRRIATIQRDDGLLSDRFEESVKMSTYLVAFVVCDYKSLSNTTKSGVKVSVYAPPEQIDQATYALEAATSILDYYETFFGLKYPMPKQDLIAIPDFAAGAMENWGLITYRMTALLYDPKVSSASNKQWVAIVVAHELAHQWFGNLVTMKWWNDLWLNEGFASYTEYIGTDHKEPSWNMLAQFIPNTMVPALYADSRSSSHPVSVPVADPAQISEIFDSISYEKGSSIIRMLEGFIGLETLQKGLQEYLTAHKFGNAETKDLWNAMTKAAKASNEEAVNVSEVMDTWTLQMGYPVVNVTRTGSKVQLTQQRFLLNPRGQLSKEFTSPYNYTWHVPILYITDKVSGVSDAKLQWMKRGPSEFDLPAGTKWFKLNAGQQGFYRVHYGDSDLSTLIQLLHTQHTVLSDADRANLLDDTFSLYQAGYVDILKALELTKYLMFETEYVPWNVGLENLQYIGMMLELKSSYKYYEKYIKMLIEPMLQKVGFAPQPDDSQLEKYLRSLLLGWAVRVNDEPTVEQAKQMYEDWMNGADIEPDLKNVVYRAGIQYGSEKEWDHAWSVYKSSPVPSEKRKLLYALSTTRDAVVLTRFLDMSLDESEVRKGDTIIVISHIAANPAGRVLAWRFVQRHWDTFMKRYGHGSFDMATLILRTTSKFTSKEDHKEVKEFFENHPSGSGARAVVQTLESIEMNIDWLERNEHNCVDWLKQATQGN